MPLRLKKPQGKMDEARWLDIDASVTGAVSFKDPVNLRINGQFEGTLETKGNLSIGETARVRATIHGESVRIAGSVDGPVTASKRLEILGTARVIGKIASPTLIVHEGAVVHGACEMLAAEPAPADWMTVDELARYLEIDADTVIDWAEGGRLPGRRDAAGWRFDRQRVEEWLAHEKIK